MQRCKAFLGEKMGLLEQAAGAFIKLLNVEYRIILSAGKNKPIEKIVINFHDEDLFHIIGLQYLIDIELPKNKKNILAEIRKGRITDEYISHSEFYDGEKTGHGVKSRIEKIPFIEEHMDSNDFDMSIYKNQHSNRTKIKADYLITCRRISSENEYYIFLRKRKGEEKYCIVSCFPKGYVTYWGGKRYLMLKEKIMGDEVITLFRHPKFSD